MSGQIFLKTSCLTWIFDHVTWKSIGNIYFLPTTSVCKLATSKQRGQKILSGQHLCQNQHFSLEIWPYELKSIGNIYSLGASTVQRLATFNGSSQKILSRHRWVHRPPDSPTDRCKTICPHFSKGDRTKFHWNTKSFYLTGAQPILAQSLCKITVHVTKNVGPKWI